MLHSRDVSVWDLVTVKRITLSMWDVEHRMITCGTPNRLYDTVLSKSRKGERVIESKTSLI